MGGEEKEVKKVAPETFAFQIRGKNGQLIFQVPLSKDQYFQFVKIANEVKTKPVPEGMTGILALNIEMNPQPIVPPNAAPPAEKQDAYSLLKGKTQEQKG